MPRVRGEKLILVVEDDPQLRALYRVILTGAGYAVVALEDGLDALRWAEANVPDAVVLDLGLPRVSGWDVQQEFHSHPETRHVPVVVVSGLDAGPLNPDHFACVLKKPVTPEALIDAVADCLRQRH